MDHGVRLGSPRGFVMAPHLHYALQGATSRWGVSGE